MPKRSSLSVVKVPRQEVLDERRPDLIEPEPALAEIAEQIKIEHAEAVKSIGTHAMAIGELLLKAQIQVQVQGLGWGAWVNDNLPFTTTQAAKYLRIAKARAQLPSKPGSESTVPELDNLSLAAATKALIPAKPPKEPKKPKPATDAEGDDFDLDEAINAIIHNLDKVIAGWDQDQVDRLVERMGTYLDSLLATNEEGEEGEE